MSSQGERKGEPEEDAAVRRACGADAVQPRASPSRPAVETSVHSDAQLSSFEQTQTQFGSRVWGEGQRWWRRHLVDVRRRAWRCAPSPRAQLRCSPRYCLLHGGCLIHAPSSVALTLAWHRDGHASMTMPRWQASARRSPPSRRSSGSRPQLKPVSSQRQGMSSRDAQRSAGERMGARRSDSSRAHRAQGRGAQH